MFVPGTAFQPCLMFGVRPELTQVKRLLSAPLQGMLLALPTNIRLGWKGLPGTNTVAYYKHFKLDI